MVISAETDVITPRTADGWRAPPKLMPSEWATQHVILPRGQSPRPGRLDHRNAPYLPTLIDLLAKPGIAELNIIKAAQIGVSEAMRWYIGFLAHTDPDPVGLALPDEKKGGRIVSNRIIPMMRRTPVLAELMSSRGHDTQKQQIKFSNGFILHLMWSGSPSAMASDPMRIGICDEVDKFAQWAGREAHAADLISKRLRAYEDRARQINISTPTTRAGVIWQRWEGSDIQLRYLVACPKCGARQSLVFDGIKWGDFDEEDQVARAHLVEQNEAAWYECRGCGERMSDRERRRAIQGGKWGTIGPDGLSDGNITDVNAIDAFPRGTRVGAQIPAMCCTWTRMAGIAAEFLRAKGSMSKMFDFRTQTLGEIWEQDVQRSSSGAFAERAKAAGMPEGLLPAWTAMLIMSVDTQKDHFWVVIRAWGPAMRSARIWHGRVVSFSDLDQLLRKAWPVEGDKYLPRRVDLTVIDSGGTKTGEMIIDEFGAEEERPSRTMEVYAWTMGHGEHAVRAIRGAAQPKPGRFIERGRGTYTTSREQKPVPVWLLDVHHFQDELTEIMDRQIREGDADQPVWRLNSRADPEYDRHMSNLQRVPIRRGSTIQNLWMPIASGARVDYRACEGYMVAAAYMAGIHLLPDLEVWQPQRDAELRAYRQLESRTKERIKGRDGQAWLASQR